MPTFDHRGFRMHYDVRGSRQPLVLLHGGMGIGSDWGLVFAENPAGWELIVPDLRGHGRSTSPASPFTFRECAKDVLALLDHLGHQHVSAIGLSLGAKTLLHAATLEPLRIDAMVLVSAVPRFPDALRAAAATFTNAAIERLTPAERDQLRRRHPHGDGQLQRPYEMMRSFAESHDDLSFTREQLQTISARTLIVHGDRDPLYPVELAIELFRGIPASALWIVPYGGHGDIFGDMAAPFVSGALAHLARGGEGHRARA
jgi:pimeloyl-ACP methyl ester carboxylesterase